MRCHGNHALSHSSNGFILKGNIFPHLRVSQNNLTHNKSFPDGARLVLLDPRVLRNVHAVTFYRYSKNVPYMYHIFGHVHYDIFILKQNSLLIIKVSFSFIT